MLIDLNVLASELHHEAIDKGHYDRKRDAPELIALIHSECSELLEAFRHGNPQSEHDLPITQAEEECADILIRLLDLCGYFGFNIQEALVEKREYNKGREYRHGKEF